MTVLAGIFVGRQPSTAATPHFAIYLMLTVGIFYTALAVWAILTVIGILRLRSWAAARSFSSVVDSPFSVSSPPS
ncbi:MAG: hypothetical protein ABI286_04980 [Edaphobacter sp.]